MVRYFHRLDSYAGSAFVNEEIGHEIGMPLGTAECDAAAPAVLAILLSRVFFPGFSSDSCRKLQRIEL